MVRRWRHKPIDSKKKVKKKKSLTQAEAIIQIKKKLVDLGLTQTAANNIVTKHRPSINIGLDYNKTPEEIVSRLKKLINLEVKTKAKQ